MKVQKIIDSIDSQMLLDKPNSEWRTILSKECHVFVFEENYIAKRFDSINYKLCDKNTAKEILIDNLYALLRFKYFPAVSDEIDEKIDKIVASFTKNLKTSLLKISFDVNSDAKVKCLLPNGCLAFRNGVYDFFSNKWLFKYNIISVDELCNKMYLYDDKYIIFFYININFEPLDIDINEISLKEFIDIMKEYTREEKNYCFELMYNMSYDIDNKFQFKKFNHLCEILGYTLMNSFSQNFVFFIGSGSNGKNSLFDGCITNKLVPLPANNSLKQLEEDRFITGALENRSHNFFFETKTSEPYKDSTMLKAITGSMYQTIENKGINKYSSMINCKYIWSANDQEKIKFDDTSEGFRRRINMIEIYYHWDNSKRFLKKGDYYDTTFSDDLHEIKNNIFNTIVYIYFGMYGLLSGTKNNTKNFKFTENDWRLKYSNVDISLKEKMDNLTINSILKYIKSSESNYKECKVIFYDTFEKRLYESKSLYSLGYKGYDEMIKLFEEQSEDFSIFSSENDIFMNLRILQQIIGDENKPNGFTQNFKKLYNLNVLKNLYNNQSYVKMRFIGNRLQVVTE